MSQPLQPTASIDDKEKHLAEHAEYASSINGAGNEHAVVMPQSLVGLTDEENAAMDKRITTRIDWIIMPVSARSQSQKIVHKLTAFRVLFVGSCSSLYVSTRR
jgi:hypothetical protein